ncbi:MAG: uracil-DNA glycosylase [Ignavibacteria bacterium]|nr:uracil-DNA glycosylase [Ignavibacteria bacterium]
MDLKQKLESFFQYLKENYGETIFSEFFYSSTLPSNKVLEDQTKNKYQTKLVHSLDIFSIDNDWYYSQSLNELESKINTCTKCELGKTRIKFVFGSGNPNAEIMLIGEAPGADEDVQGLPFVGRAGQLLTKLLKVAGIERKDVYIANILKCRPPNNRKPLASEIEMCKPYLVKQIELIKPKVIVALGATAVEGLLNIKKKMSELRGNILTFNQIPVIVTYHPAALLRNPKLEKDLVDDLNIIRTKFSNLLKRK